jgi:hypothetical protein
VRKGQALESEALNSVEEYLQGEKISDVRHELVSGKVFAILGGSLSHNRISENIFGALDDAMNGSGCRSYINDVKVMVRTLSDENFYYPDVVVTCDLKDTNNYCLEFSTSVSRKRRSLLWPDKGDYIEALKLGLILKGRFAEVPAGDVSEVAGDEHEDGEQEEGDDGGEQDAEGEGGGHGFEELGLDFGFEEEGGETEEGGEGGQEDGTEAVGSGLGEGFEVGDPFLAEVIDVADEDEGVVYHDAGEGEDSEDGEDRDRDADEEVAEECSDDAEGDDRHDDERLKVAAEGNGDEDIDQDNGENEAGGEGLHGLGALLGFSALADGEGWEFGEHFGEVFVAKAGIDFGGGGLAFVDGGFDGDDAFVVVAFDGGEGVGVFGGGDNREGGGGAVGFTNAHFAECFE